MNELLAELLTELSNNAHVKIRNHFTGLFNTPETTEWILEAEHCTHRGHYFRGKCESPKDLPHLIGEAITAMKRIENRYREIESALQLLYPDKDEYIIAKMARGNLDE